MIWSISNLVEDKNYQELHDFEDECDAASNVIGANEDESDILVKSVQNQPESSYAESSFSENVDKLEDEFGQMSLNKNLKII